jgi:hypothetical protein
MKSHTGGVMSLGTGAAYAVSKKQKLNTKSTTESELVGIDDVLRQALWTKYFMEGQGYGTSTNRLEGSRSLRYTAPRRFLRSEADIEIQILDAMSAIHATFVLKHVKSHQDTKYPERELNWPAVLNQHCDTLASLSLHTATTALPTVPFLPASKLSLTVGAHSITHHLASQLRYAGNLPSHRNYLFLHHQWAPAIFGLIACPLFHKATLITSFLKRLFLIKWANDLLPFQFQQYRFHFSPTANCSSACGCPSEDWEHFTLCPHPSRIALWKELPPTLAPTFEHWHVDPFLPPHPACTIGSILYSSGTSSPEYTARIYDPLGNTTLHWPEFTTFWIFFY